MRISDWISYVCSSDLAAQAPLPPGSPHPFFLTNPVTSTAAGRPVALMVGDAVLPNTERSTTVDEFTPSATLDVRITPDVLGYFTFSRGFKSGGFTQDRKSTRLNSSP